MLWAPKFACTMRDVESYNGCYPRRSCFCFVCLLVCLFFFVPCLRSCKRVTLSILHLSPAISAVNSHSRWANKGSSNSNNVKHSKACIDVTLIISWSETFTTCHQMKSKLGLEGKHISGFSSPDFSWSDFLGGHRLKRDMQIIPHCCAPLCWEA